MGITIEHKGMTPEDMEREYKRVMAALPDIAGQECVNFFKARFDEQGWYDEEFQPWQPRKQETPQTMGHKILQNSTLLMGSIHVSELAATSVSITADRVYAQIHNEGGVINGNIPITAKSRKYFWAMYFKTRNPKYKAMALTKQTSFHPIINMPQRQFMGDSKKLREIISKVFTEKLSFLTNK